MMMVVMVVVVMMMDPMAGCTAVYFGLEQTWHSLRFDRFAAMERQCSAVLQARHHDGRRESFGKHLETRENPANDLTEI